MIDNAFRRLLPRFVGPLIGLYRRFGLTPNHVTWIGFGIALLASLAVAVDLPLWALGLWWLSRLADGTDGIFARSTDQVSELGGYLDIVLDMAAYGAMVIGFAIAEPDLSGLWLAMLFFYVLCIASALALGTQEAKLDLPARDDRGLRLGAGLAEGGETGIAYSAFLIWPEFLAYSASAWVAVLFVTVVARSILAKRILGPRPAREGPAPQSGSIPTRPGSSPTGL